jgi:hypothetical protein
MKSIRKVSFAIGLMFLFGYAASTQAQLWDIIALIDLPESGKVSCMPTPVPRGGEASCSFKAGIGHTFGD